MLQQYGKFCGTGQNDVPTYKSGKKKSPIDSLDKVCQKHDECYQSRPKEMSSPSGYTKGPRFVPCICQRKLAQNISSAKFESGKSTYKFYPCLAAVYFYLSTTPCFYKNKNGEIVRCNPPISARFDERNYCYYKWKDIEQK